jgi:transcriptional regulator with XRE-family HTH domain
MNAARSLRHARRRAGLTQRDLAQQTGIAQPTIARIEGITAIGACSICQFATANGLAQEGAVISVGSRGDSYDNALAERSTACTRPKSSTVPARGRGARWETSNSPPAGGCTGGITAGCCGRSEASRRPSTRPTGNSGATSRPCVPLRGPQRPQVVSNGAGNNEPEATSLELVTTQKSLHKTRGGSGPLRTHPHLIAARLSGGHLSGIYTHPGRAR